MKLIFCIKNCVDTLFVKHRIKRRIREIKAQIKAEKES